MSHFAFCTDFVEDVASSAVIFSKSLFHALHQCFDNSLLLVIKSVLCASNVSLKVFHVVLNLVLDDAGSLIMVMKWIRFREAKVSTQCKAMSFNLVLKVE